MSRRGRGRRKSSNTSLIAIVSIIAAGIALFALIKNGVFTTSIGESTCGSRQEDTERNGYCLTTSSDFDELVIVTGNTQNSPAPNLDFTQGELYKILGGVFYSAERGDLPLVSIISASGNNYAISYKQKYKPAQNIIASNNELRKLGKELSEAIQESPTEPGANYLGAIMEAKSLISGSSKRPLILVVGSGYSDSGALNFASKDVFGRYRSEGAAGIINMLSVNRSMREGALSGMTVYWYNMGSVVAPQSSMNSYKTETQNIYTDVLSYLGAKDTKLNFATQLTADAKSVESQFTVQPTYVDELQEGDVISVNENIGRFEPNTDTLLNYAAVKEKLTPFASHFNPNSNLKLVATGYTYVGSGASCNTDGQLALSRANVIKSVLVDLGIPSDKISTVGERGAPPNNDSEAYTCNSVLDPAEQRTVIVKVVKE